MQNTTRVWRTTADQLSELHLADQASLDAITRQLPDGFYSTFRTYGRGTRAIGLKSHLRRLFAPVSNARINEARMCTSLRELLRAYPNEARVRMIMSMDGQAFIAIESLKLLPRDTYEKGVKVETVEIARNSPRLKSTAFIGASDEERKRLAHEGIFEALLVKNGKILEGMTSNFFYLRDDVLCTAQRDVLLGVTRQMVINVARGRGLDVKYQPLKRDQLSALSEAFITSSSRGVVPVVQIDEVTIGEGTPGKVTRLLMPAYDEYVLKKAERI